MISYEIYKVIHLFSLMVLFTGFTLQFWGVAEKKFKIFTGIATLLVLVSGMGLIARIGISHGEAWPMWIRLKVLVWFIVGVGAAVVVKRLPQHGKKAYVMMMTLFLLAAVTAVYKF